MAADEPPPDTPPSDPAAALREAAEEHSQAAADHQRRTFGFATAVAALGPVAVLLLAVQALAFPHGGTAAVLLILGEMALLTGALALAFLGVGRPSHTGWIDERLRAELLRREAFLLESRVGPYLREPPDPARVAMRLDRLRGRQVRPQEFLELEDALGSWWDQLEDRAHDPATGPGAPLPGLRQRIEAYLRDRVLHQKHWFGESAEKHEGRARRWENAARLTLVLATVAAGVHLGLLLAGPGHTSPVLHVGLVSLAIVLPSVGAAFVGLLSIRGSHRLERAYRYNARILQRIEEEIRRLQDDVERERDSPERLTYRFKRLVLRTEELLSDDFRQWWLMTRPEPPRPGA